MMEKTKILWRSPEGPKAVEVPVGDVMTLLGKPILFACIKCRREKYLFERLGTSCDCGGEIRGEIQLILPQ
jgi:hypothetical protein